MQRPYTDGSKDDVEFFIGTEVEHTPAYGMKTLFVVGLQNTNNIVEMAKLNDCTHIFVGANQSFDPTESMLKDNLSLFDAVAPWDDMILILLKLDFLVTLDFDIHYSEVVLEMCCAEYNNFIPQISVKIPYITLFNYNAMLKIDDKGFNASNPGVWCHSLNKLMDRSVFTDWLQYKKDKSL